MGIFQKRLISVSLNWTVIKNVYFALLILVSPLSGIVPNAQEVLRARLIKY